MNRIVAPEWLDELPPSDRRAIWSRRDLRRVNFWMGNRPKSGGQIAEHFHGRAAAPPGGIGRGRRNLSTARGSNALRPVAKRGSQSC